ncbi:hypothetical protein [Xylanimonas sp. McL0601]|uniref:hypothetical protein n=1 Tax=Xylanimonas sp. McL0601 TaxID=3414739 RepID=UPI003CF06A62
MIVFAAMAIAHWIETTTGWSPTARPLDFAAFSAVLRGGRAVAAAVSVPRRIARLTVDALRP